jgi:hypothetical protein
METPGRIQLWISHAGRLIHQLRNRNISKVVESDVGVRKNRNTCIMIVPRQSPLRRAVPAFGLQRPLEAYESRSPVLVDD